MYLGPKDKSNNPTDKLQNETKSQHVKKLQGKSKQWISSETETRANYSNESNETTVAHLNFCPTWAVSPSVCV